jgi:hypothetical protein
VIISTAWLGLLTSWTALQSGWIVSPARPTVGDTVWLALAVPVPVGWRVRPGRLEPTSEVEPLGDPVVARTQGGWVVRYPVVAWSPGSHTLALPPIWRLGPDGQADSVAGGAATFQVRSVLPDTGGGRAEPQPAIAPLRPVRRTPWRPLAALVTALAGLAGAVWWRRRPPRVVPPRGAPAQAAEAADAQWLTAGEPKAVAARAAHRLRAKLAAAIPAAREALATAEVLEVVEREAPHAPVRALTEVLTALDQVAFASAHGVDVAALAGRARTLARELGS